MDIRDRFPGIEPITKSPTMQTVNGIGTRLYGKRDFDPETGTYIATLCFCVLYIPLFALKAFRVLPDGDGWYFIGRHPLSTYAKTTNLLVVAALMSAGLGIWWTAHTNSAEYKAGEALVAAREDAAAGRVVAAADRCRGVFAGGTSRRGEAVAVVADIAGPPLDAAAAGDAAKVLSVAIDVGANGQGAGKVDVYVRGLELMDRHGDTDPAGAIAIADVIANLTKDPSVLDERRHKLLENLVAARPDDMALLSQLAAVYERRQDYDKCLALLEPHQAKLGDSEGARILGQIYAGQDRLEESFALLNQYTTARLQRLHDADTAWQQAYDAAANAIVAELQKGSGPKTFYDQIERASEAEKPVLVDEYIWTQLEHRPDLVDKRKAVEREGDVVPVALDLGIVRLRRAQSMTDPAARKKELEAAEQTFIAIKAQMGQSDTYNQFLAQVKYWLGKHEEGKLLFDQMLAKNNRDSQTLYTVAIAMRGVGEQTEARALAEEAYKRATDAEQERPSAADVIPQNPASQHRMSVTEMKHNAAHLRATLHKDDEDEILWLQRANTALPGVKASLAEARGREAARKGDDVAAAGFLREAAAHYESMPLSSTTLNNAAVAYSSLYFVSGDLADANKCIEMQEKALALNPSDAILLSNTAHVLAEAAMRDLFGSAIDFKLLKLSAQLRLGGHLYHDEAGRKAFVQRLRGHAGLNKAVAYYERSRLLSSKRPDAYQFLASYRRITQDATGLKQLLEQARGADLDLQDHINTSTDFFTGKKDAKTIEDLIQAIKIAEERLARVRAAKPNSPTLGVAMESVLAGYAAAESMGMKADAQKIVALAEEWHAAAGSARSHHYLMNAMLMRAGIELVEKDKGYAKAYGVARRSLGHGVLIATMLQRGGPLADAVAKHPDVQRAMELSVVAQKAFPNDADAFGWALLKHTRPADAEVAAVSTRRNEASRLDEQIDVLLAPMAGTTLMVHYWNLLIDGRDAEAAKLLADAAARGVPLP